MTADRRSPEPEPDDSGFDRYLLLVCGIGLFVSGAACGAMLYAFGLAGRRFDISVLRGGLLTFGVITLLVVAGVGVVTMFIHAIGYFWPRSLTIWSELRILRRARKRTLGLLATKRSQQEERARLTAKLQATFLLEKESAAVANQQSLKELRTALQLSAVRSCEIVNEHLSRTIDHYQELLDDIEGSILSAREKQELISQLNQKLSSDTQTERQRSAQSMMESAIWDVRLQKARMMAERRSDAALAYLKNIRQRAESQRVLIQIDNLIRELSASA